MYKKKKQNPRRTRKRPGNPWFLPRTYSIRSSNESGILKRRYERGPEADVFEDRGWPVTTVLDATAIAHPVPPIYIPASGISVTVSHRASCQSFTSLPVAPALPSTTI